MTRREFYATIDDILEIEPGTVTGKETLTDLPNWDSLAVVNYIATCNGLFGVMLKGDRVKEAKSVEDLINLIRPHIED